MDVHVVSARDVRLGDLQELWAAFLRELDEVDETVELNPRFERMAQNYLISCLQDNKIGFFAAMAGEVPVGYAIVKLVYPVTIFTNQPHAHISDIYVREAFRRQGVGTKLMEEVLRWVDTQPVAVVEMATYVANPVEGFYSKFGFRPHKISMLLHNR